MYYIPVEALAAATKAATAAASPNHGTMQVIVAVTIVLEAAVVACPRTYNNRYNIT